MEKLQTQGVQEKYDSADRTHYEEGRWASSPVAKAGFILTKEAIERSVLPHITGTKEYLELGSGPGTWTKVIRPSIPTAHMHLVDISSAMLASAKKNIGEDPAFTFTESDFLVWTPSKEYDVFFSSRAIEYFPDKRPPIATIAKALRKGGEAFLITKLPHYRRMRFLGKDAGAFHEGMVAPQTLSTLFAEVDMDVLDVRPVFVVVPGFHSAFLITKLPHYRRMRFLGKDAGAFHEGMVTPHALKALFSDVGMDVLDVCPVFVVVPVLHSATLNLLATRILRLFPWNPLTASITESYLIRAKKR